jgi:excisionase family DNA binding protein
MAKNYEHPHAGFYMSHEAAKRLKVSMRTIRRFVLDGKLAGKKVGHNWQINIASVEGYRGKKK